MNDKHSIQLEGLRFYAVLMVMIAHWLQWQWGNTLLKSIPFVHGVTLFFVLSGFLISRILFSYKELYLLQNANRLHLIGNFYMRRFFRIFPIYYLSIFILFLINFENTRALFPWLITYTTNIYQSIHNADIGSFNHFWSLAVEEQFYLFWPFLILFVKTKRSLLMIISVILIAVLCRCYAFFSLDNWRATSYFTLNCMHALGIGALLAYLTVHKPDVAKALSKPIWLVGMLGVYILLLILQVVFQVEWYKAVCDDVVFSLVAGLVVLIASGNGFKGAIQVLLENSFVRYSGKISYGLYILHLFTPALVAWLSPQVIVFNQQHAFAKYLLFFVYYSVTFVLAHLSFKFLETPINRLKGKFPYRPLKK